MSHSFSLLVCEIGMYPRYPAKAGYVFPRTATDRVSWEWYSLWLASIELCWRWRSPLTDTRIQAHGTLGTTFDSTETSLGKGAGNFVDRRGTNSHCQHFLKFVFFAKSFIQSIYCLLSAMSKSKNAGVLERKKINAFNILILFFVGLGSMSYGYTASVIGQTLVCEASPNIQ
jgi:hypothetical protein